jgi:hypothetical protein
MFEWYAFCIEQLLDYLCMVHSNGLNTHTHTHTHTHTRTHTHTHVNTHKDWSVSHSTVLFEARTHSVKSESETGPDYRKHWSGEWCLQNDFLLIRFRKGKERGHSGCMQKNGSKLFDGRAAICSGHVRNIVHPFTVRRFAHWKSWPR